ncbi:MAG: flagellar hook-associated protein FlgL [Syntrophorhabdaceae bacterium]|nr:flagellar hook-associated protein FlgL [Syntrophorhabdaceae bacterium]
MRVSTPQIYRQTSDALMQSIANLYKLNEQIGSGKRINRPSDDVTGAARALDYKVFMENGKQYLSSISSTANALSYFDSTFDSVDTALSRLKELSIVAANGATSDTSRYAVSVEAGEIRDHILTLANTKVGGTYIFSGFKTDTRAYDNSFAYQGDAGLVKVGIGGGMLVTQNVTGPEAFTYTLDAEKSVDMGSGLYAYYIPDPGGGPVTTVEIRASDRTTVLDTFSYGNAMEIADLMTKAMEDNNIPRISALIGSIDDMADHVYRVRAEVGARMNVLDSQDARIRELNYTTEVNLSSVQDADIVSTASDFVKANSVLSAVQLSTVRILSQSLLDFLR